MRKIRHSTRGLVASLAVIALVGMSSAAAATGTIPPDSSGPDASASSADDADTETSVSITVDDHEVPGTYTVPANADGAAGAVLLLHGFASQKDEVGDMYRREAAELADRGIASLRIDFAGTGDSAQPYTDNTWPNMVGDALAAYDWLVAQPETADNSIGVLGFSLGAKVALEVVAERPDVPAMASWSGALYDGLPTDPEYQDWMGIAETDGSVVADLGFTQVEMSLAWFETMAASTPLTDASSYIGAVLAIAGADDTTVDSQVSQDFLATLNTPDETLLIIPGADHIYHVLEDDQTLADRVITVTADWFALHLAG